ncbi:MAG: GntR family transcriptional regulator, partial [Geobacteraceae bacterium]|nr:GntR family transcriptional regulator [Geobacteraceae bacterium]
MKAYEEKGVEKTLLYEEVSGRIVEMIQRGTYRPGERIPSLRALSRQMRV